MADDDRTSSHSLEPQALAFYEALRATPYAFDFFQALRRIDALNRERPRIGESRTAGR